MRAGRGFTYFTVLFLLLVLGLAGAAAGSLWQAERQRERERELLAIGDEFRVAIERYVAATPGGPRRYPRHLEDLLLDPRTPGVTRHLRRIYRDPMTQRMEWGVVRAPDGGIMGVHSLSEAPPVKRAGFHPRYARFESAARHADWAFIHRDRHIEAAARASAPRRP